MNEGITVMASTQDDKIKEIIEDLEEKDETIEDIRSDIRSITNRIDNIKAHQKWDNDNVCIIVIATVLVTIILSILSYNMWSDYLKQKYPQTEQMKKYEQIERIIQP